MAMTFASLAGNLEGVREKIGRVQAREGLRQPVRIVAVTKGHPAAAVRAAVEVGLRDVGESRVQEALAKQETVGGLDVRWHLVGHLQTNKAKHVAGRFVMVHSIDTLKVAEALDRHAGSTPVEILVQVNVAGETQKYGCSVEEAPSLAEAVNQVPGVRLVGLMTIAPLTDDLGAQRAAFGRLRRLQEACTAAGLSVPELSMGMSNDYESAIAEGATIVRLGTVLFGERPDA